MNVLYEHNYKANKDLITKAIVIVNNQMLLYNQTLLHIMSNFIANMKMIFEDRVPPWFDKI